MCGTFIFTHSGSLERAARGGGGGRYVVKLTIVKFKRLLDRNKHCWAVQCSTSDYGILLSARWLLFSYTGKLKCFKMSSSWL